MGPVKLIFRLTFFFSCSFRLGGFLVFRHSIAIIQLNRRRESFLKCTKIPAKFESVHNYYRCPAGRHYNYRLQQPLHRTTTTGNLVTHWKRLQHILWLRQVGNRIQCRCEYDYTHPHHDNNITFTTYFALEISYHLGLYHFGLYHSCQYVL